MLVNLTYNPKACVAFRKMARRALQENPGQDYRAYIKKWQRMNARKFSQIFKRYEPQDWEYASNDASDYTGVYIVNNVNMCMNLEISWISKLPRQSLVDPYDEANYETGDVWYNSGLCDNASQAIAYYAAMKAEGRFHGNHVILLSQMGKGGWRWHKWGDYIGEFKPRCEYFCDEEGIKDVWFFQIVRVY